MKIRLSLLALAAGAVVAAPAAAQQVTFMTGPQGGSWIPLGGALKGMWEKNIPGLAITQTPGAGIANVRGVDEGKAQIGLSNSNTAVLGVQGEKPYPKKVTNVCQLANLYPQYFQVVASVDAGVNSLADLKGKSLVTQPKGNTGELLTEQVLKKIGMNAKLLAMDWASVVARRSKMDPPAQGGWHIFHTFWVGADLLNPVTNAGMNAKGTKGSWFGIGPSSAT